MNEKGYAHFWIKCSVDKFENYFWGCQKIHIIVIYAKLPTQPGAQQARASHRCLLYILVYMFWPFFRCFQYTGMKYGIFLVCDENFMNIL